MALTTPDGEPIGKDAVGELGEKLAARHLRSEGYKILYRNFRPSRCLFSIIFYSFIFN